MASKITRTGQYRPSPLRSYAQIQQLRQSAQPSEDTNWLKFKRGAFVLFLLAALVYLACGCTRQPHYRTMAQQERAHEVATPTSYKL